MFGRGLGVWEIGLILVIILIVFGVGKLPQVGSALGKGMRAFRKGQQGEDDVEDVKGETDVKSQQGEDDLEDVKGKADIKSKTKKTAKKETGQS